MVQAANLRKILLLTVISMCGCTTLRIVAPGDVQAELDRLQTGDRIAVRDADAWQEDLTVVRVTGSSMQVDNARGEQLTFVRSEITEIKVRVSAPGKTAGLAAGIFLGVLGSGIPGLSL